MQPKPPTSRGPMAGPAYQPPSNPPVSPNIGQLPTGNRPTGGSEQRLQSSNQYLRTPVVRYSSRMRVGKLHPIEVTLGGANGAPEPFKPQSQSGGFDPPIVVQVSAPGAIVTPPHVIIPVSGGTASFVVQPLMSGKLAGAKVEFLSQGRKVSEIALPMKANRGTLSKLLLLFAILLPFLINFLPEPTYRELARTPEKFAGPVGEDVAGGSARIGGGAVANDVLPSERAKAKTATPNKDASKSKAPRKDAGKTAGKTEAAKTETPKTDAGKTETPKTETPKTETPKTETPKTETPKTDAPKKDGQLSFSDHVVLSSVILMTPDIKSSASGSKTAPAGPKAAADIKSSTEAAKSGADIKSSASGSKTPDKQAAAQGAPGKVDEASKNQPEITASPGERVAAAPADEAKLGLLFKGEDAIWTWTRSQVEKQGYQTRRIKMENEGKMDLNDGLISLFTVERRYEIVGENVNDWSTGRAVSMGLYYCESAFRWIYRMFISFPKSWPFGDLIYAVFFLALAAIVWLYTSPNRKKIKGPVMDIRLAGA